MRVLVLGASGGVGRLLVAQGVERGVQVRALVRADATAPPGGFPAGAEVIVGDVRDPSVLVPQLDGVDAVLCALGLRRRFVWNPWSALRSPPDLVESVLRVALPAAKVSGVRRFLAVSAAGVGDSAPAMNAPMRALVATSQIGVAYADLARAEALLAASGLDWQAPRPVVLTDGPRTGRVAIVSSFGAFSQISRADVAGWMLDRALDPAPDALKPRTPMIAAV